MGEENAYLYRTALYLAASASAEFLADIALSPMECVKVSCFSLVMSSSQRTDQPVKLCNLPRFVFKHNLDLLEHCEKLCH